MRTPAALVLTIGTLLVAGAARAASAALPDVVTSYSLNAAGCYVSAGSLTLGQAVGAPAGCTLGASFLAAGTPDPSVSFSLGGDSLGQAALASVYLVYYFQIVAPVDELVALSMDGAYSLFAGVPGLGGSSRVNVSDGFSSFTANSLYDAQSGSFHMTDTFMTNVGYQILLEADGSYRGIDTIGALLDPTLTIDPSWLSAHPGATLELSAGLDNISAVPEPSTWRMGLIGGLALLAGAWRQRRRTGAAGLEGA